MAEMHDRTSGPFINATYFPNTPVPGLQPHNWSSTTSVANAFYVLAGTFNTTIFSATSPDTKGTSASGSDMYHGRCVSGP